MVKLIERLTLLFLGQIPAFIIIYSILPGYGTWIIIYQCIWVLVSMIWFTYVIRPMKKKWLLIPLALFIAIAGQVISWMLFLFMLFGGGHFSLFPK